MKGVEMHKVIYDKSIEKAAKENKWAMIKY